jgi:hypothetical protein
VLLWSSSQRLPKSSAARAEIGHADERAGETVGRIEHRRGAGEALAREQCGEQPVHRGLARMERLRHRAERLREARRLRARDAERVRELARVEPEHPPRGCRRPERADRSRHVPAALREPLADHAADARRQLEAGDERGERVGAGGTPPFPEREDDRRDGGGAVEHGGQVRVVEVERVALRPVGERREQRARPRAAAHDRRLRLPARRGDHRRDGVGERLDRPADGGAEPVRHRAVRGLDHRRRQRRQLEAEHEVDERVHHRSVAGRHGDLLIARQRPWSVAARFSPPVSDGGGLVPSPRAARPPSPARRWSRHRCPEAPAPAPGRAPRCARSSRCTRSPGTGGV